MDLNIMVERRKARKVVEQKSFDYFIMFLICMDAVVLGLLTIGFPDQSIKMPLFMLDRLCMAIFIVEMLIKMYAYGPRFFKAKWNIFDLSVIAISSLPVISYLIVLRTFRLFRLLKYINRFKQMNNIMHIFWMILPNFFAMSIVLGVFVYVFAIMGVCVFGDVFVEFSDLASATFALLQTVTLDGWISGITRPIMIVYPYAWIYFISFLLIAVLLFVSFFLSVFALVVKKEIKNNCNK